MQMLMRIQMRRLGIHQLPERVKLALAFRLHRGCIRSIDYLVGRDPLAVAKSPFGKINVEADAELLMSAGRRGGFFRPGAADHQARASDDAPFVRFDDAPIYATR